MYKENVTVFAETTFRNRRQKFGVKVDDRRRHMYLIGKTGMGKSTVMENMIIHDIRAGKGVAVVDPHGDLAEKVMQYIPAERIKDVIYFNPADMEHPIAFNIVEQVDVRVRHLVASGLVGVFKKLWADSWGPRLEYILRNAILAILDYPDSTLLGVVRMLSDKPFRKKVMSFVQDPVVKAFWEKEFAGYADKFASEAVSPIQNKVGQFLSSSLIRNIVGQKRSAIDMREVMDSGKVLILNLSKGHIGEDNSALLGAMMITKIQLAAMSRVNILEDERRDFYLYIDEFQNFSTESFATILSEARKYHLNLIMAHQYIEQLDETVKAAVFGNVGTLVCFRVGATDAEELVKEFTPTFMEEDILNLPKYEFYLKLMIDGVASDPFSARGLAPLSKQEITGNFDKCVEFTRSTYAKDQALVEDEIMNAHFMEDPMPKTITAKPAGGGDRGEQPKKKPWDNDHPKEKRNDQKTDRQNEINKEIKKDIPVREPESVAPVKKEPEFMQAELKKEPEFMQAELKKHASWVGPKNENEVVCSMCSKMTIVNFKPDGIRPIYCKDCRSKLKKQRREGPSTGRPAFLAEISPSQLKKMEEPQESSRAEEQKEEISLSSLIAKPEVVTFSGKKDNGTVHKEEAKNDQKQTDSGDIQEGEDIIFE